MKNQISKTLAATLALSAFSTFGADVAAKTPAQMLKDFNGLVRDKNATFEAVSNAYAKVSEALAADSAKLADATKGFIGFHADRKAFDAALAIAEDAMGCADIPSARRADFFNTVAAAAFKENFKDSFGGYHTRGIDFAARIYARTLEIKDATGAEKVAAYRNLANMSLEATHVAGEAFGLLDKAIALPGLTADQKGGAILNKAELLARTREFDKALALCNGLLADGSLSQSVRRRAALQAIDCAGALSGDGKAKATGEIAAKYPGLLNDGEIADRTGKTADYLWGQVKNYEKGRFPDVVRLVTLHGEKGYDALARELPAIIKVTEAKDPQSLRRIFAALTKGWNPMAAAKDPRFATFFVAMVESVAATNRPSAADVFAFVKGRKAAAEPALKYAREVLAAPASAKEDLVQEAAVLVSLADAGGNASRAVSLMSDWAAKNIPATNKLDNAAFLLRGVKTAMQAGDEEVAKALYAARAKYFQKAEPRSIKCAFIKDAPQEIPEILASAFYRDGEKGLLDRKFGDDLKFIIETDVTKNRTMTEYNGKAFRPTEIFAFCDKYGVKIMLREYASAEDLAKFRNGFGGLPGYESYLATGFDTPYTFVDFSPASRNVNDSFVTQYDNGTGYRNLRDADGSITLKNYIAGDSAVTLISASWEKEFNALPENGGKWYYEPLNWLNGGWSWGGSKGVHNRSSFGALVFEGLTPEALASIKRVILPKAAAKFRNACSARNAGCIENWKDPVLGDVDFYEKCVAPLEKRLSSFLGKVRPEMTDAEVNEVYDGAAKEWLNIDYVVSRLRTEYLAEKFVSE